MAGSLVVLGLSMVCAAGFGASPAFTDATAAAGLSVSHNAQLFRSLYPPASMVAGGAVGDFNNDGWQDILFLGCDSPDRLFINNGDGTFTDQAPAWGVDDTHMGIGATVGDFNADGWLDIYVTSVGPSGQTPITGQHKLYRNNGDGTFTDIAATAGVADTCSLADGFGSAFGDYDLDGDLDLFVTSWRHGNDGNRLYRNNGDETFTDVTLAAGLTFPDTRGFSPRFVDMDGDCDPELLLAADFVTSRYFINNGDGTFTDHTGPSGTALDDNGMGQSVGDVDNDGLLEWYVTSVYLEPDEMVFGGNTPGTGNMLYRCVAPHTFVEDSVASGVNDGGWGWGTSFVDLDHDGLVDLLETNGWNVSVGLAEQSYLWHNQGDGTFTEMALAAGLAHFGQGRGLTNFDADNDGDQDVAIFQYNGPFHYFENLIDEQADTNWLRVFLDTSARPDLAPNGFGSRVSITVGATTQLRSIDGGCNYLTLSELSAHFGVADATTIDELRIKWTDGQETVMTDVAANQTLTITPPACDGDADGNGTVDANDIAYIVFRLGNTGNPGEVDGDADGDGLVNVNDIGYVVFRLGTCN